MAYFRLAVFIGLSLLASACNRGVVDYIVPLGHPADPGARAGEMLVVSDALDPELQSVNPQVTPAPSRPQPAPPSGGHQH